MKKISVMILGTLLMTSCATIFCGSRKQIVLDANIDKASSLTIDGTKYKNVSFPYPVKIRRGFNETIVKGESEGYLPYVLTIKKDFNAVSVVNLTNLLGWGIDAATGAMMKPEFNNYELEFTPITNNEKK